MRSPRALASIIGCSMLLTLPTGCVTRLYVNFENASSEKVKITSVETDQTIQIVPNQSQKFLHSSGDILVRTDSDHLFKFEDIEPASIEPPYRGGWNIFPGPGRVILNLQLQTDMQIYVLLPGEETVSENFEQPYGYPKAAN